MAGWRYALRESVFADILAARDLDSTVLGAEQHAVSSPRIAGARRQFSAADGKNTRYTPIFSSRLLAVLNGL